MTRLTTIARASVLLAVTSGILALTPPAFAADDALPQARLNVAGVDFTSDEAIAHLKAKLRHTALEICGYEGAAKEAMSLDTRKCYDAATRNGMAQIDSKHQQALRDSSVKMAAAQPQTRQAH